MFWFVLVEVFKEFVLFSFILKYRNIIEIWVMYGILKIVYCFCVYVVLVR